MRPLRLSFSGIRSYPGTVGPLDFTGKKLIAIVGDTGAGKSTLLEAITLALYGTCTWSDRDNKALMAEGAAQMAVDLTFAHDGQPWRVRRTYHANTTPSTHFLQNLDTGEQTDNRRAVDRRIERLLQLSYDSFKTAVLLPQGKFDRLLTATGGERTGLLKSIFGTQAVEFIRSQAGTHREQLRELIHQAELARAGLLKDPAAAARTAAAEAEQAEQYEGHFRESLETLRSLRGAAAAVRDRHGKLTTALAGLDKRDKKDIGRELAGISEASSQIAALITQAADARQAAGLRRDAAEAQLTEAAHQGLTRESLASASTVLGGLPARIRELTADQEQLGSDEAEIADQATRIEAAQARLAELQTIVRNQRQDSAAADAALREYRALSTSLRDSITNALREAASAGQALRHEQRCLQRVQDLLERITPLGEDAARTGAELRAADDRLAEIRSHDSAHAVGTALSPGQPCLVCQRPLPDDYLPPAPIDPQALRTADRELRKAKKADQDARDQLTKAKTSYDGAREEYEERHSHAQIAQARLSKARESASSAMQNLAGQARDESAPLLADQAFDAMLQTACSQVSEASSDDQGQMIDEVAQQLIESTRTREQQLADAAAQAAQATGQAETDAATASATLAEQRATRKAAEAKLNIARRRHAEARDRFDRDLRALPAFVREQFPADGLAITSAHVDGATRVVADHQSRIERLENERGQAARELEDLTVRQRQLDQRLDSQVTRPLQALTTYLERWHDAIEQAASILPGGETPGLMSIKPGTMSAESAGAYATALARAEDTARGSLAQAATAASEDAGARLADLERAAAELRAGQHGTPAVRLPEGGRLLEPGALDPVIEAATSARDDARRHRADQLTAESQIQQAGNLDTAISAGHARLSALEALRSLLADAKFLQYLTDRRTHALLGVASSIFSRLSGGEFGFAENFQIVSRRSGAARSPRTLSGGETFLASLALALALVEMHSRSGARLDALFLDEGFGSLDADALTSSLAVLQAETGGNKLVAVISHLHAVAETVEDVMWVERQPDGSTARWLTAAERDALVRQEITSGLLSVI